jgi:hypothetical protein
VVFDDFRVPEGQLQPPWARIDTGEIHKLFAGGPEAKSTLPKTAK